VVAAVVSGGTSQAPGAGTPRRGPLLSGHPGMHLQGFWHEFMADAGNKPGAQQGDVVTSLLQPVAGVCEVTVPSDSVGLAAEAGSLTGM
jgi:hypothetical protein